MDPNQQPFQTPPPQPQQTFNPVTQQFVTTAPPATNPVSVPAPAAYGNPVQPASTKIKNHRILAILAILSTLIFGAPALAYSLQVDKAVTAGDVAAANKASKRALVWSIISLVVGVLGIIVIALSPNSQN